MNNEVFVLPKEYIVFDLETTGLSPKNAEIIEIGAIKIKDGKQISSFHSYIKPICGIPPFITALTSISPKTVENAEGIEVVLPRFLKYIEGSTLVAHNASFDCRFIQTFANALGLVFSDHDVVDTLKLARGCIPTRDHKLETLKEYFGLSFPSHNALDDCRVTVFVAEKCREMSD